MTNNPLRYIDPTGHSVDCGLGDQYCGAGKLNTTKRANDLYRNRKHKDGKGGATTWHGLTDEERSILSEGNWDEGGFNDNGGVSKADLLHDPLTYLETAVVGSGFIQAGLSLWGVPVTLVSAATSASTGSNSTAWQFPSAGPITQDGLTFSQHALERMLPVGLGGRGIPPSVVQDVVANGARVASSFDATAVKVSLNNVTVLLNYITNTVITVRKGIP